MRLIRTSVVMGAAVLLLSAVGCGDDDDDGGDEGAGGTQVDVVLSEFIIEPSEDTVDAGEVTFNLDNQGGETHEFVVVDAASVDDLPLDADEAFDEAAYGEDNVLGEVEDVESGATAELTVDMAAGDYLLLCNIVEDEDGESESHFAEGMHTEFTVE
jgi:uncharacterized cupredoxin-like copper-binding protein